MNQLSSVANIQFEMSGLYRKRSFFFFKQTDRNLR